MFFGPWVIRRGHDGPFAIRQARRVRRHSALSLHHPRSPSANIPSFLSHRACQVETGKLWQGMGPMRVGRGGGALCPKVSLWQGRHFFNDRCRSVFNWVGASALPLVLVVFQCGTAQSHGFSNVQGLVSALNPWGVTPQALAACVLASAVGGFVPHTFSFFNLHRDMVWKMSGSWKEGRLRHLGYIG